MEPIDDPLIGQVLRYSAETQLAQVVEWTTADPSKLVTQADFVMIHDQFRSDEDKAELVNEFPELKIKFTGRRKNSHSKAATARKCLNTMMAAKHDCSQGIVDLGGNSNFYMKRGYRVHMCCPLLNSYDHQRQTNRRHIAEDLIEQSNKGAVCTDTMHRRAETVIKVAKSTEPTCYEFMCNQRCQDCEIPGRVLMSVDSIYDVTISEFVECMIKHRCEVGSIAYLEPSALLMGATQGIIPEVELAYSFDNKDVSDSGYVQGLRPVKSPKPLDFGNRMKRWFKNQEPFAVRSGTIHSIHQQWADMFQEFDTKGVLYTFADGCIYSHSGNLLRWSLIPSDFTIQTSQGVVTVHVSKMGKRMGYTLIELTMIRGRQNLPRYINPTLIGNKEFTIVMNWPVEVAGVITVDTLSMSVPVSVWEPMVTAAQSVPDGVGRKLDGSALQKKVQDLRSLAASLNSRIVVMGQQITQKERVRADFASMVVAAALIYGMEQKERTIRVVEQRLQICKISRWEQLIRAVIDEPLPIGMLNQGPTLTGAIFPLNAKKKGLGLIVLPPHTPWTLPKHGTWSSKDIFEKEAMVDYFPEPELTSEARVLGKFFEPLKQKDFLPPGNIVIDVENGEPMLKQAQVVAVLGTTQGTTLRGKETANDAVIIRSVKDLVSYKRSLERSESSNRESREPRFDKSDQVRGDTTKDDTDEQIRDASDPPVDQKFVPRPRPGALNNPKVFTIGQEVGIHKIMGPFRTVPWQQAPDGVFKESLRQKNHDGRQGVQPLVSPYVMLVGSTGWTKREQLAVEEYFTITVSEYNDSLRTAVRSYEMGAFASTAERNQRRAEGEWVSRVSVLGDEEVTMVVDSTGVINKHDSVEQKVFLPEAFKPYYEALRVRYMMDLKLEGAKSPDILSVMGVPGCGKTRMLIKMIEQDMGVITTTRATKDQINESKGRKIARTVDGALQTKGLVTSRALFDEVYMMHYGQFLTCCAHLKIKTAVIFGDRQQIPYICRCSLLPVYQRFDRYEEIRQTASRRITKATASVLRLNYPDITTTNDTGGANMVRSITSVDGVGFTDLKKNTAILTFDRATKEKISHKKLLSSTVLKTVHEAQGETFDHVVLVRELPTVNTLYAADNGKLNAHMVVAISRHTKSFTYCTVVQDDLAKFLNEPCKTNVFSTKEQVEQLGAAIEKRIGRHLRTLKGSGDPKQTEEGTTTAQLETTPLIDSEMSDERWDGREEKTEVTQKPYTLVSQMDPDRGLTEVDSDMTSDPGVNVTEGEEVEDQAETTTARTLKCGHQMCVRCIKAMENSNGVVCPMCRASIVDDDGLVTPRGTCSWNRVDKRYTQIQLNYQKGVVNGQDYEGRTMSTLVYSSRKDALNAILNAVEQGKFVDFGVSSTSGKFGIVIGMHIRYHKEGRKGKDGLPAPYISDEGYPDSVLGEAKDRQVRMTKTYEDEGFFMIQESNTKPDIVHSSPVSLQGEECPICAYKWAPLENHETPVAVQKAVSPESPVLDSVPSTDTKRKTIRVSEPVPDYNGFVEEITIYRNSEGKYGFISEENQGVRVACEDCQGVRKGDIIYGVQDKWLDNVQDFDKLMKETKDYAVLTVWRPVLVVIGSSLSSSGEDAIVNAGNPDLGPGGGVTGFVYKYFNDGGKMATDIKEKYPKGLETGTAGITGAYGAKSHVRYIVHTVGPDYRMFKNEEHEKAKSLLISAYKSVTEVVKDNGIKKLGIPVISGGIYGYPKKEAAVIAVQELIRHIPRTCQAVLCITDKELLGHALDELNNIPSASLARVKQMCEVTDSVNEGAGEVVVVEEEEKETDARDYGSAQELVVWATSQPLFCWGVAAIKYLATWYPNMRLTKADIEQELNQNMKIGETADARELVESLLITRYGIGRGQIEWVKSIHQDALVYTPGHWEFGSDHGDRYQLSTVGTKIRTLRDTHNYLREKYHYSLKAVSGKLPDKYDELLSYVPNRKVIDLCPAPGHGPGHLCTRNIPVRTVLHKFPGSMKMKPGVKADHVCCFKLQECDCIRRESKPDTDGEKRLLLVDVAEDGTGKAKDQYEFNNATVDNIMDQADKVESVVVIKTFAHERLVCKIMTMSRPVSIVRLNSSSPAGTEVYVVVGEKIRGQKTIEEILCGSIAAFLDNMNVPKNHTGHGKGDSEQKLSIDLLPGVLGPVPTEGAAYKDLEEYWNTASIYCTRAIPLACFLGAPKIHEQFAQMIEQGTMFDRGYLKYAFEKVDLPMGGTQGDQGGILRGVPVGVYSSVLNIVRKSSDQLQKENSNYVGLTNERVERLEECKMNGTQRQKKDKWKPLIEMMIRPTLVGSKYHQPVHPLVGQGNQVEKFGRFVSVFVKNKWNVADLCALAYVHGPMYVPKVIAHVGMMRGQDQIDLFMREVDDAHPFEGKLSNSHRCDGLCLGHVLDCEKFFRVKSTKEIFWTKPSRCCMDFAMPSQVALKTTKLVPMCRGSKLSEIYKAAIYSSVATPINSVLLTDIMVQPVAQLSNIKQTLHEGIMQYNLHLTTPEDGSAPYYTYPNAKLSAKDDLRTVSEMTAIPVIKTFIDNMTPGNAVINNQWDNELIELGDMEINANHAAVKNNRMFVGPRFQNKIEPVIRTGVQTTYTNTFKSMMSGVNKRNANPPVLTNRIAPQDKAVIMEEAFLKHICVPGAKKKMHTYVNQPLGVTSEGVKRWLQKLDGDGKVKQLVSLLDKGVGRIKLQLESNPMDSFELTLKTNPKTVVTTAHQSQMQKPQVVLASEPMITAIVSNVVQGIQKRIESVLRPCVITPWSRNSTNLDAAINYHLRNLCNKKNVRLTEIDLSAFDKSQLESAHLLKMNIYQDFGMHPDILRMWDWAHRWTTNRHYNTGSVFRLLYQHKSGDATTLLGNTLVNLAIFATAYNVTPDFMAAVGDDSIFVVDKSIDTAYVERQYAEMGNLEAKKVTNVSAYFCGSFIVRDTQTGHYAMIKDPVKVAYRLGSNSAKSEEQLAERFISLQDEIGQWKRSGLRVPLAKMAAERYKCSCDCMALVEALLTVSTNWELYRGLWVVPPEFYPKNWDRYLARLDKTVSGRLVSRFLKRFTSNRLLYSP